MGVLKMKKIILTTILIFAATAIPSFAFPISGSIGLEGRGSFTGSFDLISSTNTTEIRISLTNTSSEVNGGFLTAFAFNIPSDFKLDSFSSTYNFANLTYPVEAKPFDDFDIGAALNDGDKPSWLGGGDPTGGIGVKGTGTFTFIFSNLITGDFFSQPDPWFVARFRGFNDGGSDKVPIDITSVPEPTTMLLLGVGLIGLGFFGRKRFLK
jgi:hypothetical protein